MTRVLSLTTTTWRSFYESQVEALRQRGIELTTLEPPNEFRATDDGVRRRSPRDYVRFQGQVIREALQGYDVVHANYGLTAPIALAQPVRPVVVSLWGGEFVGNRFERPIRAAVRRASEVIVPSEAMAARVDRDCHIVPFPVDIDLFRPMPREQARARVGWPDDRPIAVFPTAAARPEKNYDLAREVVDRCDVDVELRTVSNVPYHEMPSYLNAADAILITSRWESGPMVVKEAMACNVPVVSRPVGFVPSVLEDVTNSTVVEKDSRLPAALKAIIDGGERSDGRERLEALSSAEMGRAIEAIYDRAVSTKRAAPATA